MVAETIAYPDWTEYKKKNGLDPLGMQNSSINFYQRLLPGISNVTLRVRYYGFYAWLASSYAQRNSDTNPESWRKFVRRAEALYALVAQLRGDEGGMAGVLWAQRKLKPEEEVIEFAQHADPDGNGKQYLEQAWGAYGAAYASQLFEIGIYADAAGHVIPVPSPELGESVAREFGAAAGASGDRFLATVERGTVSRADLATFFTLTPSAIDPEGVERELYENMLFARGKLKRSEDVSRRDTLLLLLETAAHLGRKPTVAEARWLLYAGADQQGRPFTASPALLEHQARWRVYQANDLLHYSHETLLKYGLDTLEAYPAGIALGTLFGEMVSAMSATDSSWPQTWGQFSERERPADNGNGDAPNAERALVNAIAPTAKANNHTTPDAAWSALRLLAVVTNRARNDTSAIQQAFGHLDREGFRSLITEMAFLGTIADEPFAKAVARIIEERVLKRHLWVAHRKFRYQNDYTFLFEADDGRIRLRAAAEPVLTNPRLGPAITFLEDIHLLDADGLTGKGKALLEAS